MSILRFMTVALSVAVCGLVSTAAHASFLATVLQVGSSVVIDGSGTIDLLALGTKGATGTSVAGIDPSEGILGIGPTRASIQSYHATIAGPSAFGTGMLHNGIGTGDFVALEYEFGELLLPSTYTSDAALSDTNTFANATFASLGLTAGTYVYTLGSGNVTDTFTIQIGPSASANAAPEAPPVALLGIGLFGLVAVRRHRKPR